LPQQEEKRIKLMLVELYQDITAHLYQAMRNGVLSEKISAAMVR
jgi:hypothetical protein